MSPSTEFLVVFLTLCFVIAGCMHYGPTLCVCCLNSCFEGVEYLVNKWNTRHLRKPMSCVVVMPRPPEATVTEIPIQFGYICTEVPTAVIIEI